MKRVRIELSSRGCLTPWMAIEHLAIGVRVSREFASDDSQLTVRRELLAVFESEVRQWISSRYQPELRAIHLPLSAADATSLQGYLAARSHTANIVPSPRSAHVILEAETSVDGNIAQPIFDWMMEEDDARETPLRM